MNSEQQPVLQTLATALTSDPLRVARVMEMAATRRKARNAKRLVNWTGGKTDAAVCGENCWHSKQQEGAV